jgi:hypothetical protein
MIFQFIHFIQIYTRLFWLCDGYYLLRARLLTTSFKKEPKITQIFCCFCWVKKTQYKKEKINLQIMRSSFQQNVRNQLKKHIASKNVSVGVWCGVE